MYYEIQNVHVWFISNVYSPKQTPKCFRQLRGPLKGHSRISRIHSNNTFAKLLIKLMKAKQGFKKNIQHWLTNYFLILI